MYKINDSGSGKGKKSYREGQSSHHKDTSNVIELADSNFDESVLKSDDAWFVLFYSPSVSLDLFSVVIVKNFNLNGISCQVKLESE